MRLHAATALLFVAAGAQAQNATMRDFLALNAKGALRGPARKRLLAEEAAEWPVGFGRLSPSPDRFVRVTPDFACARVQGLDPSGKPVADLYFYLRRVRGGWRVVAYRTLGRTGVVEMARDGLRKKEGQTSEERAELLNMDLVLASDRELRIYFASHRGLLDSLAGRLEGRIAGPGLTQDLKKIGSTTADRSDGFVRLLIGGILDDSVGFLKVEGGGRAPAISPHEYIWVEPLGGDWYLFKTT